MFIPEFIDDKYRTKEPDVRIEIIKALFNNAYVKNISIDEISNAFFLSSTDEEVFTVDENAFIKFVENTFKKENIVYIDAIEIIIDNMPILQLTKTYKEIKELFDNNFLIRINLQPQTDIIVEMYTNMNDADEFNDYTIMTNNGTIFIAENENDYPKKSTIK